MPTASAPRLNPSNKYWATAHLLSVFARAVAVSPDNSKVVIGYGVRTGGLYSNAVAYFGIYSTITGRRLATLEGDVYRNGLWESLRHMDSVPTNAAPISPIARFSPDSRLLYTSSVKIVQWDLSGLP